LYILIGIVLGSLVGFSILDFHSEGGLWTADIINSLSSGDKKSGLDVHTNAPGFSLYSLDGDRINLSDFTGTPVIIIFWATWCEPCQSEMRTLQEKLDYHQPGLFVLAVNAGEYKKEVSKYYLENELNFPALLDPTLSVLNLYQIRAYPTSYFVDSQGIIKGIHIGVMSEKQLNKYLREIGVVNG
jgi:peroxiredoxin